MKSRTIQCMKFFLTGFSVTCILLAVVAVVACGLELRAQRSQPDLRAAGGGGVTPGAGGFIITLSVLLVVAAVVGVVGAVREGTKTLYTYATLLLVLVCVEVAVGVGAAVLQAWGGGEGAGPLRQQFFRNVTADETRHHSLWDRTQAEYECCGVDGPDDYSALHREVPASCCARAHGVRAGRERARTHALCLQHHEYYRDGCEARMALSRSRLAKLYVGVGVLFILVEVICAVLAIWMARTIRSERKKLQQNLQSHFES